MFQPWHCAPYQTNPHNPDKFCARYANADTPAPKWRKDHQCGSRSNCSTCSHKVFQAISSKMGPRKPGFSVGWNSSTYRGEKNPRPWKKGPHNSVRIVGAYLVGLCTCSLVADVCFLLASSLVLFRGCWGFWPPTVVPLVCKSIGPCSSRNWWFSVVKRITFGWFHHQTRSRSETSWFEYGDLPGSVWNQSPWMVFKTLQSLVVQQPVWKQLVNFEKSSTKEDTGQKKLWKHHRGKRLLNNIFWFARVYDLHQFWNNLG